MKQCACVSGELGKNSGNLDKSKLEQLFHHMTSMMCRFVRSGYWKLFIVSLGLDFAVDMKNE